METGGISTSLHAEVGLGIIMMIKFSNIKYRFNLGKQPMIPMMTHNLEPIELVNKAKDQSLQTGHSYDCYRIE